MILINFSENAQEKIEQQGTYNQHSAGFPTIAAHIASQSLLNPLIQMLKSDYDDVKATARYSPAKHDFGVDFTLPSLRPNVIINHSNYVGIVLHRQHLDLCFTKNALLQRFRLSKGYVNLRALLPELEENVNLHKSTLSYLSIKEKIDFDSNIPLCPMDMQAFIIKR